jgi:hypothetical protein
MGHPRTFRQGDVTRAIKAAQAAGLQPHVWISPDGSLHIAAAGPDLTPKPARDSDAPTDIDAWDRALDG